MGIFERLREDTDRSELVSVLAFFAGVAAALAVGGDDLRELDGVDPAIWLFVSGLCLGFAIYWVLGWALGFVVPRLGGSGNGRRTRHVLAFSFAPLCLGILAWLIWPWLLLVARRCERRAARARAARGRGLVCGARRRGRRARRPLARRR